MSFTPARMIAYAGRTWRTSRGSRARISLEVSPLIPRFNTVHSGCDRVIQCAYWLSGFPSPRGGASRGERKPGVPAVVESPRPTIVTDRSRIGRLLSSGLTCSRLVLAGVSGMVRFTPAWGRGLLGRMGKSSVTRARLAAFVVIAYVLVAPVLIVVTFLAF